MGKRSGWAMAMVLAAGFGAGADAAAQQSATQDPQACLEAKGLDAQMACLKQALEGIKSMSAEAEPIGTLPPGEPAIIGNRNSRACHAKGQSQPVWPNGKPMGPTANIDECVQNHGAVQADFAELCEAGVAIARQAGPSNVVLRYLDRCPAKPKSMCSLKGLLREGRNEEDPSGYTARVDYLYYAGSDSQAGSFGCTDKRFF